MAENKIKSLFSMLGKNLGITEAAGNRENPFLQSGDQQAERAFQDAQGAANEGGVGMGSPDMNNISRSASTGRARQMSQDFDPSDPESVMRMQQMLNRGGYTDGFGNALKEDGKMGDLTTTALRKMQGDRNPEMRYEANGMLGTDDESIQNEESARMNLRGAAPVTQDAPKKLSFMDRMKKMGLIKQVDSPEKTSVRGSGTNRFGTGQGGRFY